MRTQWINRYDTIVAARPVKPGVWRRREGGFVIRTRIVDPRTAKQKEIRRVLPQATLQDAIDELSRERLAILDGGPQKTPEKIRFRDYAQKLLDKKVAIGQIRSAASRQRWRMDLNRINPVLGDIFMTEINRADVLKYHEHLAALVTNGKYSPRTCLGTMKTVKVIVRTYTNENERQDLVTGIPGFDLSVRRTYTRQEPNSLRPNETETFLGALAQRFPQHLTMVTLGFALGLRPSSLRALHKEDIIWSDGGWLLNRRSHTLGTEVMERTKIGKDTEVPLTPELLSMLKEHIEKMPAGPMRESNLLFPNQDGSIYGHFCLWNVF